MPTLTSLQNSPPKARQIVTFCKSSSTMTLVKRASSLSGCVHSHRLIVWGGASPSSGSSGALKVTINKASGDISIAITPFGCGLKMLLMGIPDAVSHTTSMLSCPASAVTTHFLFSLTATAQMQLQCPCRRRVGRKGQGRQQPRNALFGGDVCRYFRRVSCLEKATKSLYPRAVKPVATEGRSRALHALLYCRLCFEV